MQAEEAEMIFWPQDPELMLADFLRATKQLLMGTVV
jgi:hypothetical protein